MPSITFSNFAKQPCPRAFWTFSIALLAGWSINSIAAPPDLTGVWTPPVFAGLAPGAAAAQLSLKAIDALPIKGGAPGAISNEPLPAGPAAAAAGNPLADVIAARRFLTELAKTRMADAAKLLPQRNPDPTAAQEGSGNYCKGMSMPNVAKSGGGYPLEIIQRPEQITIIYELENVIRRIYLKDKLPAASVKPSRLGYSTGTWVNEGGTDVLVVETSALSREDEGAPHSENAKIIERYRQVTEPGGRKIIMGEVTLTDPDYYTEPQKSTLKYLPVPAPNNLRVLAYECDLWTTRLESLQAAAMTHF